MNEVLLCFAMSKRQVVDRSLSPHGMDPEPKRVHPYEDSEGEAPSSPEGSRESAPEESESDVARESDMARETSDDDEDEVATLRRQVQELRTSLKEMMNRYDRLVALFSSSLTKSTIALTNPTHQTITPTTSCHENRGERSMAEVKNPTIQQIPAAAIETTSTSHPTTTPINVAEGIWEKKNSTALWRGRIRSI